MEPEAASPVAQAVTTYPNHHFFGYYDKCPWDATGRYMLALESPFAERAPTADDAATVGLIDLENGNEWRPLAETKAWNWQQGAMLQWLGGKGVRPPDGKGSDPFSGTIIYNVCEGDTFGSLIRDVSTGEVVCTLPRPVAAVSRDGRQALCLNFARVHWCRPGYGYAGPPDPGQNDPHPENDGVWWMDLETGESRLVVSIADIAARDPKPLMADTSHWINHLQFNADGRRFIFLHRWATGKPAFQTRLYTANPDGSDVRLLADDDLVSHFDWRDGGHILVYARMPGEAAQFYLIDDATGEATPVDRRAIPKDGHCSYSPNRRLILNDEYPDQESNRTLYVYRPADHKRIDLGRYYSPPELTGPIRCDLHPRWNRAGTAICFDSAHEGTRQLYTLDFHEPPREQVQIGFTFR